MDKWPNPGDPEWNNTVLARELAASWPAETLYTLTDEALTMAYTKLAARLENNK